MLGPNARRHGLRGLLAAVLALSCLLVGASAAQAELTFKRAHGAPIHFAGTPRVWCGPWEVGGSSRLSIHVELRTASRGWELTAVQRDLKLGRRIEFPSDVRFDNPHGALLFAYVRNPLVEASTNEEEASGSMVFTQASCEIGAAVEFRVHAVLGSELFNGTRVRVTGAFGGVVGEAPTF